MTNKTEKLEAAIEYYNAWKGGACNKSLGQFAGLHGKTILTALQDALDVARGENWQPKEGFERSGTEVIGWLSSNKGFEDTTARLIYIEVDDIFKGTGIWPVTGWYWAESEEPVKRPDLINGVMPWPGPPEEN